MPDEYLTSIDEARRRVERKRSEDVVQTTEAVGDPDEDAAEATGQVSAAAGALVGAAVAGPIGMGVAAAVAGGVGAAAEAADDDQPKTRDQNRKEEQIENLEDRR